MRIGKVWGGVFAFLSLTVFISGCSHLPKVEAWERGDLARPVMQRNASAHYEALEDHIQTSRETARGGYAQGAGGCGCN